MFRLESKLIEKLARSLAVMVVVVQQSICLMILRKLPSESALLVANSHHSHIFTHLTTSADRLVIGLTPIISPQFGAQKIYFIAEIKY